MAEASWFEVDQATNALRLTAVDPSLFMRLTDLIQIISEESTEGQPFPTELVRLLDSRIMRTLQTLHGEKKLHGDISPDNVVVTHYGGCSLLHPSSWQPKAPTPFNTPYATPVGPAHDIFSLGCLLYTVATRGAMAFHGRTEEELRGDMARGCPVIPSYIPPDIADLIKSRITVGLNPRKYQDVAVKSQPKPSEDVSLLSLEEVTAALAESTGSPQERSSRVLQSKQSPSGRSKSIGAAVSRPPAQEYPRAVQPPVAPASRHGSAPSTATSDTNMIDTRTESPVIARKKSMNSKADARNDEYERQLEAARIEAFRSRMALMNKHAGVINPVAASVPTLPLESETARTYSEYRSHDGHNSARDRSSSMASSSRSSAPEVDASVDRTRKEYFEARMAMKAKYEEPVNTSMISADSLNDSVVVPTTHSQPRKSALARTPPSGRHGDGGSDGISSSMTPQQLRAARLAAEQRAYEESLTAARRQAYEDRVALQVRYGRGV